MRSDFNMENGNRGETEREKITIMAFEALKKVFGNANCNKVFII